MLERNLIDVNRLYKMSSRAKIFSGTIFVSSRYEGMLARDGSIHHVEALLRGIRVYEFS